MLKICAIISVYNSPYTLHAVLEHFYRNQIDVIIIDDGSTDKTPEVIRKFMDAPIKEVHKLQRKSVYEWERILRLKEEIVNSLDTDWVIHADADEIFESPRFQETLRAFIERLSASGIDIINCDEFVFTPKNEIDNFNNFDFIKQMTNYYHFDKPNRALHRFLRLDSSTIGWSDSGGHKLDPANRKLGIERARLRHYVGLSLDHLRSQYLGRVFSSTDLIKGWHHNRVPMTSDFIVAPPQDRLFDFTKDGWCTHRPENTHLFFNQKKPYVPLSIISPIDNFKPMPFIIGTGRCGSTLLRLLLDKNPILAMTPETHWLLPVINSLSIEPKNISNLRTILISMPHWADMHINNKQLDSILNKHNVEDPINTIRNIYYYYATNQGKARIGDKTPGHILDMHTIASILPEVRFIHIIRDGRDVALSFRDVWFGPGKDIRDAAIFWTWRIREARQQAQFLPFYLEVKYEDLIKDTEFTLQKIADFIEIPFNKLQLDAYHTAKDRLMELVDINRNDKIIPGSMRRSIFDRTASLPDESRIGRWKKELTNEEIVSFERIAGEMLSDLKYERYS